MNADMIEFDQIENVEDDYNLEDFFPNTISYKIQPLIEYRIKCIMKTGAHFLPGETQVVNTSCIMKGKGKFKLSMFIIPYENLPLSFESRGYIDINF